MATFQNRDDTFGNELTNPNTITFVPTTGATVVVPKEAYQIFINPAGTIAALTIQLPKAVSLNMLFDIGFGANVTALTFKDGYGNTLSGLATSGTAGTATEICYVNRAVTPGARNPGWVKWR